MSVRPREVADEASRFSLRSVFGTHSAAVAAGADGEASGINVQQQHEHSQQQQHTLQGEFKMATLGGGPGIGPQVSSHPLLALAVHPTAAASSGALKFTLPTMRGSVASAEGGGGGGGKSMSASRMLKAGYLSGGFKNSNDPEIMRLNGVVEDLTSQIQKTSDRLSRAEQSVARGNAALKKERNLAQGRFVALTSEVQRAKAMEAAVRVEMSAMPKVSDYDQTRFEMQAQGALELQTKYDDAVSNVTELRERLEAAELRLQESELATSAALKAAELETSAALEAAKLVEAEKSELRVQLETTELALKSANLSEVTELCAKLDTAERRLQELELAKESATLGEATELRAQLETAERRLQELELANSTALEELVHLKQPADPPISFKDDEDSVDKLKALLAEQEGQHAAALEDLRFQHIKKEAESDTLIKSLDLKLHAEREKASTAEVCARSVAEPIPGEFVDELKRYCLLKQDSDAAVEITKIQGTNATPEQLIEASKAVMYARRAYRSILQGTREEPLVTRVCLASSDPVSESVDSAIDVRAIRLELATNLGNENVHRGISSAAALDCDLNLHKIMMCEALAHHVNDAPTDPTMGKRAREHTTSKDIAERRTNAYVRAVSTDVSDEIKIQQAIWIGES